MGINKKFPRENFQTFGGYWYCNGWIIESRTTPPTIPANDLGWMRDYKVFEVMEAVITTPFHPEDHLKRLLDSAEYARIKLEAENIAPEYLIKVIKKLLKKNDFLSSLVWIYVTGGLTKDGFTPRGKGNVYIFISQKMSVLPKSVSLKTIANKRTPPHIKTTNYFVAEKEMALASQEGFDDILYIAPDDQPSADRFVLETSRKNLFLIKDGVLKTPAGGALGGVTRSIVLKLAQELEIFRAIETKDLRLKEVLEADEVFVTSTSCQVTPVTKIDSAEFPIGEKTVALKRLFAAYREEYFRNAKKRRN